MAKNPAATPAPVVLQEGNLPVTAKFLTPGALILDQGGEALALGASGIAALLKLLLANLSASAFTWEERIPGDPRTGFLAKGGLTLFGCGFHLEARPVEWTTADGSQVSGADGKALTEEQWARADTQWGANDDVEEELKNLRLVNDAFAPYETVVVNGYDCVITLTPYCR